MRWKYKGEIIGAVLLTLQFDISAAMLNSYKNLGALLSAQISRLTRVERTKYELGDQQRSETEWKFGMDARLRTPSRAADRRKPSAGTIA